MKWTNNYKIAFFNAVIVIKNGYPFDSWIAPIPNEHKADIWEKAIKYLKMKEKERKTPSLF